MLEQGLHPRGLGLQREPPTSPPLSQGLRWGPWRTGQGALSSASCTVTKSMSQTDLGVAASLGSRPSHSLHLWTPSCNKSAPTPCHGGKAKNRFNQARSQLLQRERGGHQGEPRDPHPWRSPCLEFPKWLLQGNQGNLPHVPVLWWVLALSTPWGDSLLHPQEGTALGDQWLSSVCSQQGSQSWSPSRLSEPELRLQTACLTGRRWVRCCVIRKTTIS